jgi:hypothetical protein
MVDPKVSEALEQTILPFVFSARKLKCRFSYICYKVYTATLALLAMVGVGGATIPAIEPLRKILSDGQGNSVGSLQDLLAYVPEKWRSFVPIVGALLGLLLGIFKWIVHETDAQRRTILAKSCIDASKDIYGKLYDIGSNIFDLQNEAVITWRLYKNHKVWPWAAWAKGIDKQIRAKADELYTVFGQNWDQQVKDQILRK